MKLKVGQSKWVIVLKYAIIWTVTKDHPVHFIFVIYLKTLYWVDNIFSTTLLFRILIMRKSIRVLDARYRIFIDGFTGNFEYYCLNFFFPYACISLVALFVSYFMSPKIGSSPCPVHNRLVTIPFCYCLIILFYGV